MVYSIPSDINANHKLSSSYFIITPCEWCKNLYAAIKNALTLLKSYYTLTKWFYRPVDIKVYCKSVMKTLFFAFEICEVRGGVIRST